MAFSALSTSAAKAAIVRLIVASEATGPYTPGSARNNAASRHASPPNANETARSVTTFAGSCLTSGFRHGRSASLNATSKPETRTVRVNSTPPACATAGTSAASTRTCGYSPLRLLT